MTVYEMWCQTSTHKLHLESPKKPMLERERWLVDFSSREVFPAKNSLAVDKPSISAARAVARWSNALRIQSQSGLILASYFSSASRSLLFSFISRFSHLQIVTSPLASRS